MMRSLLLVAAATASVFSSVEASSSTSNGSSLIRDVPSVKLPPNTWLPQSLVNTQEWAAMEWKDVQGCCSIQEGDEQNTDEKTTCADYTLKRSTIGQLPQFTVDSTLHVLEQATEAWNGGSGTWTQMTLAQRIAAIQQVFVELQKVREEIVEALMWEIGKNRPDAEAEFDRTVQFAMSVIETIQTDAEIAEPSWQVVGSTHALIRRAALGIILCMGPYNYPLNETYATLIPALLMGNICILKIPSVGGIAHLLTMEAFAKVLPPGTIGFVSGPGRNTAPPLMKSGKIDGIAFIGGSEVADELIKDHPHPHRLKVFLQLEANNMAIYLNDLFENTTESDASLQNALDQAIVGSLSYNGQRCTALKLHMVPTEYGKIFAEKLVERVEAMSVGLPWQLHANGKYSAVTPLPNARRIKYMNELLDDALAKGAKIMNKDGGQVIGGSESTLMVPAVLYPVTSDMRLYHEEQFGPLIPVTEYSDIETCLDFGRNGIYAQQVSIFGHDAEQISPLVDAFAPIFGKINLNSQCGRSPDTLPFSGRRSSAMGVMSVKDALKEFSTPTVVAYKKDAKVGAQNEALASDLEKSVNFMQSVV